MRKILMNTKASCSNEIDTSPEDTADLIRLYKEMEEDYYDELYVNTLRTLMVESSGSPVWLCDVAQRLVDDGFGDEYWQKFPEWAFKAHACYRVTLRPCDVESSMWVAQVQASETISPSGRIYHTVTLP